MKYSIRDPLTNEIIVFPIDTKDILDKITHLIRKWQLKINDLNLSIDQMELFKTEIYTNELTKK